MCGRNQILNSPSNERISRKCKNRFDLKFSFRVHFPIFTPPRRVPVCISERVNDVNFELFGRINGTLFTLIHVERFCLLVCTHANLRRSHEQDDDNYNCLLERKYVHPRIIPFSAVSQLKYSTFVSCAPVSVFVLRCGRCFIILLCSDQF